MNLYRRTVMVGCHEMYRQSCKWESWVTADISAPYATYTQPRTYSNARTHRLKRAVYTRLGVRIKRTSLDNGRPLIFFIPSPFSLSLSLDRERVVCIRTDVLHLTGLPVPRLICLPLLSWPSSCIVLFQDKRHEWPTREKQRSKLCLILVLDMHNRIFFFYIIKIDFFLDRYRLEYSFVFD